MVQPLPEEGFIRIDDIIGNKKKGKPARIPVSRATLYSWIKAGKFPPPDKRFGEKISVWNVKEIRPLIK